MPRGSKKQVVLDEEDDDYDGESEPVKTSSKKPVDFVRGFKLSSFEEKVEATCDSSPEFYPFPSLFKDVPKPTHQDDWLAQYKPRRQPFKSWMRTKLDKDIHTTKVYLRTIGDFDDDLSLESFARFVRLYYPGVNVDTLPSITIKKAQRKKLVAINGSLKKNLNWRICHPYHIEDVVDPENTRQLRVDNVLDFLQDDFPEDAYCVVALTTEDLYEGEDDSFVVGMAAGNDGVAVFSFKRYDPSFGGNKRTPESAHTLFYRGCKVLVHEIGHLFGIEHCTYFECCMNGSGHLEEDYRQPLHLCPVDLKKVQHMTNCDVMKRYNGLLEFYKEYKFKEEEKWTINIIDSINKRMELLNDVEEVTIDNNNSDDNHLKKRKLEPLRNSKRTKNKL